MKTKLLLSAIFGVAAWSLSSMAAASWNTGPCPGTGTAPCIEAEVSGNTYHFNGSGGHAGEWHGLPTTGEDFDFVGDDVELDCALNLNCTLTLSGKVKKCQDSGGAWRIGVQVNSADVAAGDSLCGLVSVGGFPWYSKDPTIANHCPFEDNCDNFIPYNPSASSYTANFGTIDVTALGMNLVDNEHVHGVVFTPGAGANFSFASDFYDCNENADCSINGVLTLDNATSLDIK